MTTGNLQHDIGKKKPFEHAEEEAYLNLIRTAAALAVDFLVRYLGRHTLALFGWWRIAVAAAVLILTWRWGLRIGA